MYRPLRAESVVYDGNFAPDHIGDGKTHAPARESEKAIVADDAIGLGHGASSRSWEKRGASPSWIPVAATAW